MKQSISPIVEAVGKMHISGDIVPPEFFHHVTFENGKPDLVGILILANLLYWYRPTRPRSERTDTPLAWRQKFTGSLLQRSYAEIGETYGITERMARNACHRLRDAGLITIKVQSVGDSGIVTFLAPVPERIAAILHGETDSRLGVPPLTLESKSETLESKSETLESKSETLESKSEFSAHDKERARARIVSDRARAPRGETSKETSKESREATRALAHDDGSALSEQRAYLALSSAKSPQPSAKGGFTYDEYLAYVIEKNSGAGNPAALANLAALLHKSGADDHAVAAAKRLREERAAKAQQATAKDRPRCKPCQGYGFFTAADKKGWDDCKDCGGTGYARQ